MLISHFVITSKDTCAFRSKFRKLKLYKIGPTKEILLMNSLNDLTNQQAFFTTLMSVVINSHRKSFVPTVNCI